MQPKLIALDLDGTLLNGKAKISQRTKRVLAAAQRAGHHVVIATGRPDNISERYYDQLHLTTPMINFNGALIHRPHQHWAGERQLTIHRQTALALLQLRQAFPIRAVVAEGKQLLLPDRPVAHLPFFPSMRHPRALLAQETLRRDPISMTFFIQAKTLPALQQAIQAQFPEVAVQTWGAWSGDNTALEVIQQATNKASALDHILPQFGLTQRDVIAFGDDDNDAEMLTAAGLGIAMANAKPQIQALAGHTTRHANQADGVARFLARYLAL